MMESLQAACIRNGHVPQKPTAEQRNTCRQKIHGTPEYQKTISELSQKYEKLETEIKSQKQSIATNAAGNYMKNVAAATVVTA